MRSSPTSVVNNVLEFDRNGLREFFSSMGEVSYRADQVINWVHQRGITDWSAMTNLSKALRAKLQETLTIKLPEIILDKQSEDGTRKWLLRFYDGNSVEMVFIPQRGRGTLCISSQVGCALNCSFCSTGKQGFSRDLSLAEIISQLWIAVHTKSHAVTNVVMMGMGEPLLNFDNVVKAINLMMDDLAYGLSKYRVTVSTSGVIPAMEQLKKVSKAALAVSLHAPTNDLRDQLVPLNKKYPLEQLIPVCKNYFISEPKRFVTFEYVMLAGVNDHSDHAKQLVKLLKNVPCKVNLIPFNPFPLTEYTCSAKEVIEQFQSILKAADIHTTVRLTRGDDIIAACGQLVGQFQDRTKRHERWIRQQNNISEKNDR